MPRRAEITPRKPTPDPVHQSELVSQMINRVMTEGKKSTAEKVVYTALDRVAEKTAKPKKAGDRDPAPPNGPGRPRGNGKSNGSSATTNGTAPSPNGAAPAPTGTGGETRPRRTWRKRPASAQP